MKRNLRQRGLGKLPARFDREVPMGRGKKPLPENATRRGIRWLGVLRKILMDPALADEGDLFQHATSVDWQNHRRMSPGTYRTSSQPIAPYRSKKQRKRDWEVTLDE